MLMEGDHIFLEINEKHRHWESFLSHIPDIHSIPVNSLNGKMFCEVHSISTNNIYLDNFFQNGMVLELFQNILSGNGNCSMTLKFVDSGEECELRWNTFYNVEDRSIYQYTHSIYKIHRPSSSFTTFTVHHYTDLPPNKGIPVLSRSLPTGILTLPRMSIPHSTSNLHISPSIISVEDLTEMDKQILGQVHFPDDNFLRILNDPNSSLASVPEMDQSRITFVRTRT